MMKTKRANIWFRLANIFMTYVDQKGTDLKIMDFGSTGEWTKSNPQKNNELCD